MKCIIFDCDGVLVDSEMITTKHFIENIKPYGFSISAEESIKRFTGKSAQKVYTEISAEIGRDFDDELMEKLQQQIHADLHRELNAIPGIQDVLTTITDCNLAKCVASSGTLTKITKSLTVTGLAKHFHTQQIFSVDHVKIGKPAPDLFLYAANAMGFLPSDCVVVEDSIAGIEAAKSAKMPVIGFVGGSHAKYPWYQTRLSTFDIPIATNSEELKEILIQFSKDCLI